MLTNKVKLMDVEALHVKRESRQRSEIDVSDLLPSVKKRGVIQPILVHANGEIIAGERRWTAARAAGLPKILARIAEEHDPFELQMLEFEENFIRQELPWQDRVRAFERMYKLYSAATATPTQEGFATYTGYSQSIVSKYLTVAEELAKGNEKLLQAPSVGKAINVVRRTNERAVNNAISDIMDHVSLPASGEPPVQAPEVEPESIIQADFHEWAREYRGPKFNLVHCDFPFGVDLQDSDQAGHTLRQMYDDEEQIYWQLLDTLAETRDNVISSSAHMVFWFSMEFYTPTLQFFHERFPEWTFEPFPLVWWKTDNKGIAPDVERRPRRVYETALFGWRGDRKLVRLASNCYGAPKANSNHVSEKPEPVLKHFLSMVCDSHSRVLDPTCGSGSAIRAAEALGARMVLGLERDPDFAADAASKLKSARALAKLSGGN